MIALKGIISKKSAYGEKVRAVKVNSTKDQSGADMSLILKQMGFKECQSCYNTRSSASAVSVQLEMRSNHACRMAAWLSSTSSYRTGHTRNGLATKYTSHILSVCCRACSAAVYVWCNIVYLLAVFVCYS